MKLSAQKNRFEKYSRATVDVLPQTFLIVLAVLYLVDLTVLIYLDQGLKDILNIEKKKKKRTEKQDLETEKKPS